MNKVEILAPAGNMDCFLAAINAGADAVYMAGKSYGARAEAGNFTEEEFVKALDIAHIHGRKIYLTLNTLVKEKEWGNLYSFLLPLYEAGLGGVIIQDLGLLDYLSRNFPKLPLHASTQMTITHPLSAKLLKESGIVRVVPARELSLDEIKNIKEEAGVEVEAFIHGAMCYCYSGQCLFSSFLGGRSGNRGRCAGTCRLPYSIDESSNNKSIKKDVYPLSLKDLCTIDYIGELIDAGIDSFKIEGRLKSPEYVAGVTHLYRKYVDFHLMGQDIKVSDDDRYMLENLYLRGSIGHGYYHKHNGKDMVSLENPSYSKGDDSVASSIYEKFLNKVPRKAIYGAATFKIGSSMCLTVYDTEGNSVTVTGGIVSEAQEIAATKEDVKKRLNKTGGTNFFFDTLDVTIEGNCFIPVGELNALKREGIAQYESLLLKPFKRELSALSLSQETDSKAEVTIRPKSYKIKENYSISIMQTEQLKAVSRYEFERIYIPYDLFYGKKLNIEDINTDKKLALSLPRIIRKRDGEYLESLKEFLRKYQSYFERILVRNLEELEFVMKLSINSKIEADSTLYAWNKNSRKFLKKYVDRITSPLELSLYELMDIEDRDMVIPVYGYAALMVSSNCIANTADKCTKNRYGFDYTLTDRYKKKEGVFLNCIHCYNEIYNALPTSLHKKTGELIKKGFGNFRIDFTLESNAEIENVLDYYLKNIGNAPLNFTYGHIDKGAI